MTTKPPRVRVPPGTVLPQQRSYRPIAGDADLVDQVIAFLARHRPELAEAVKLAEPALRAEFGGGDHYVHARSADDRAAASVAAVLGVFSGRNVSEVARELGISRATVYRRLRQAGKR